MDLLSIADTRVARSRTDLVFAPGERPLAGGTWLFSVKQTGTRGFIDLTELGWPSITDTKDSIVISATCTVAELAELTPATLRIDPVDAGSGQVRESDPRALFWHCANAFLASFKIWNVATVGGNIALALPAGPMTSLLAALDADLVIWEPDGTDRRMPVSAFVTGTLTTALRPGEVIREIVLPKSSLAGRAGFRRIALNALGRTGTLVIARQDRASDETGVGEIVFTVTGGTDHPEQFRFERPPTAHQLAQAIGTIDSWFTDAHGAADWRKAMTVRFAEQLRIELGGTA